MRPSIDHIYTKLPLPPWLAGTVETLGGGQYHLFITEHLGSCSSFCPEHPPPSSHLPGSFPFQAASHVFSQLRPELPVLPRGFAQRTGQSWPHSGIQGWGCHSYPNIPGMDIASQTEGVRDSLKGTQLVSGRARTGPYSRSWDVLLSPYRAPRLLGAALGCGQEKTGSCDISARMGGFALEANLA